MFYIQKSGTFDGNNSMLKLGRVRLNLEPDPFSCGKVEQRLVLNDGYVQFKGCDNTIVKLWVDAFNPVIHVEVDSDKEMSLNASCENWRYQDYQFRTGENGKLQTPSMISEQHMN